MAAVHYHFGSKEDLLRAVMERRLVPLNRERLQRLDALRSSQGPGPAPLRLEPLLGALLGPAIRLGNEPGGERFMRLLGRLHSEPERAPALQDMFLEQFREVIARFVPSSHAPSRTCHGPS